MTMDTTTPLLKLLDLLEDTRDTVAYLDQNILFLQQQRQRFQDWIDELEDMLAGYVALEQEFEKAWGNGNQKHGIDADG